MLILNPHHQDYRLHVVVAVFAAAAFYSLGSRGRWLIQYPWLKAITLGPSAQLPPPGWFQLFTLKIRNCSMKPLVLFDPDRYLSIRLPAVSFRMTPGKSDCHFLSICGAPPSGCFMATIVSSAPSPLPRSSSFMLLSRFGPCHYDFITRHREALSVAPPRPTVFNLFHLFSFFAPPPSLWQSASKPVMEMQSSVRRTVAHADSVASLPS